MSRRYRIIDEVSYNLLGTFDSRGDALDCVAALLNVNDDDFLDELTIASDDGKRLAGDALRHALEYRAKARERVGASSNGGSHSSDESAAMAAKSRE